MLAKSGDWVMVVYDKTEHAWMLAKNRQGRQLLVPEFNDTFAEQAMAANASPFECKVGIAKNAVVLALLGLSERRDCGWCLLLTCLIPLDLLILQQELEDLIATGRSDGSDDSIIGLLATTAFGGEGNDDI